MTRIPCLFLRRCLLSHKRHKGFSQKTQRKRVVFFWPALCFVRNETMDICRCLASRPAAYQSFVALPTTYVSYKIKKFTFWFFVRSLWRCLLSHKDTKGFHKTKLSSAETQCIAYSIIYGKGISAETGICSSKRSHCWPGPF